MSGPRIKPHVQRIGHLVVDLGFGAQHVFCFEFEPRFDALLLDAFGHHFHQFLCPRMDLPIIFADEKCHGNTPATLARNTPVGPVPDHRIQAGASPFREEFGLLHGLNREPSQGGRATESGIHPNEPLPRGAKDDGGLVPPAMRIAVLNLRGVEQACACLDCCD